MAAVLDAMAPYVQKLIKDMAEEEASMLLGVSGEITKLEDNMEGIKAFLADAERRRVTDESVRRWVSKLKGAMYDATHILDLCQLEADKRRGGSSMEKLPGCFQPLLFCLRNPVFAHRIGSRIKELNQRLDEIRRGAAEFDFLANINSNQNRGMTADAQHLSSFRTMAEFDEMAIVGENIKRDTKELAQVLVNDDNHHDLKVVSIVGMGGSGKTTLAQKIFKEATVQEHFKTRIWLSITQHFDEAELLRFAIKHAGRDHGEERDRTLLVRTLTDALSESRFLLVMDDVWSDDAWSRVLSVPIRKSSQKQPGSRVLVTTRIGDLAPKMGESFHQHHVSPLDVDDAWPLLKKQLPPDQLIGIDRLKNIGMQILQRCEGLPLAIKVIGGVLSTRYASERDWNAVLTSPTWSVSGLPEQIDSRIYLSYQDLSPQLKQCFLYCALFPKGIEIVHRIVTRMWISEGFIQPPDESSSQEHGLEEMATEYYRELIRKNLIEPTEEYSLTGYKCTMHDVVRSFAEYMAREESVVVVHDRQLTATCGGSDGGKLVRRLSMGQTISTVEWVILQKRKSLRTLIINSSIKFQPGDSLRSLSSLRVLYIRSAYCDSLVASLSKLKHLRYLHLEDVDVSRLPDDIQQMKFLQVINLQGCEKLGHLPSSIVKLVHLRSLVIRESNVTTVPKGFGGLTNLRTLLGFPVHMDDMDHAGNNGRCSLQELAPLSQLRELSLNGLGNVPASWMAEKAMIGTKDHLWYLELSYSSASGHMTTGPPCGGGEAEQKQQQQCVIEEEVLEKLCPPIYLEHLVVKGGYAGRQLPNWMRAPASAADFRSLRILTLKILTCCTQLPGGLCYLSCLELLIIEDAPAVKRIGPEFQAPSSLPAGDNTVAALAPPFPRLRELHLLGLREWEEWEWNDDGCEEQQGSAKAAIAMPCLEALTIDNCKLRRLPPGLASISRQALRGLNLYDLTNLTSVENFPSVLELEVFRCPDLKRISVLSRLHKIRIVGCPNVEVLEGVPSLDSLELEDATMEALPGYLQAVSPRYLELGCGKKLCESLLSPGSSKWSEIRHIGKQHIYHIED